MKTVFSNKDGKPIIFLPSSRGYLYIAYVWIVWKSVFLFKSPSHRWAQTKGAPELLLPRVSKVKFTVNKTNKSQALLFVFSFIGNSTLRSVTLRERLRVTESWTHIESRQFIGWWRDAVSDAMTSSGHTGEHAIHSSDFSAFTKRSHCPSLLRFLTHLLPLRFALRRPFALRRLPQWNFVLLAVKCHGVSSLYTAVLAFHRSRRPTQ